MNLIQIKQIEGLAAYIQENVPAVLDGYQVVFQTGDQVISGTKEFAGQVIVTGETNLSGTLISSGLSYFDNNVYISGELWITGSDGTPVQITGGLGGGGGGGDPINKNYLVYTTGTQYITGEKQFLSTIKGHQGFYITGDGVANHAYIDNTWLQVDSGPDSNRGLQVSKGTSDSPSLSIYNYLGTEGTPQASGLSGTAMLYAGNTNTKHFTLTNATKSGDIRFFTVGDREDHIGDFDWWDPSAQRMIISSGGNVGIGVTGVDSFTNLSVEPLERLHVSGGNFRVDGNIYTSGQLWITGTDGLPRQISGEGGGGSIGDYITALGISGYNLSGQTLWVGHGGIHVSGDSQINGDLTLQGQLNLTGGATVGEEDGDNVFLVGTNGGGQPRIGMGEFPGIDDIDTLVHISGGDFKVEDGFVRVDTADDSTLGLVVVKDEDGVGLRPSMSIYNFDGDETAGVISKEFGKNTMLYGHGHHFTIQNVTPTGDIRFFTLGNEVGGVGDWYDPAQQRMIIHSGGNIGIGVTGLDPSNKDLSIAPLEKLHVSGGNLRIDGDFIGTGEYSRPTVQGTGVMLQGEEFPGVSYVGASSYAITEDARNKVLHFRPFLSDISVELPTTDDFKNFKFTARVTGAQNNFVGFAPDNSSYNVYGEGSGIRAQHSWATIYRGETEDWFMYGDPLVNAGPPPTTAPPTTPGPTTPPPTTAPPTTTPEPSPGLLKDGLMMRFFAWDDPDSNRASSFSSSEPVEVNGVVEDRSVIYPSYKSPLLPQLTGAFSDDTTYSTWDEAAIGTTDTHGTSKSGVYLKDAAHMVLPQFQLDSVGGQWDSFNGAMNFLTGAGDPLNIGNGWTICWWSYNKWPSPAFNPKFAGEDYKIVNLGSDAGGTSEHDVGLYLKLETTTNRVQLRGNASNEIYATDDRNLQSQDANMQYTTGMWWTFHSLSYGGGQLSIDGAPGDQKGNNIMWAIGTGNPDDAPTPALETNIAIALYSGDQNPGVRDGYKDSIGIFGGDYATIGDPNPFIEVGQQNTISFGYNDALGLSAAPWTGYISDFRLYSGALGTGELNAIFTGQGLR